MINFANPTDDAGRDRRAARSRDRQVEVADIGDVPPVANPERKEACRLDLKRFLVDYFPHSTGLTPLSVDHDRVVARMQNVVLSGGRQCNVVYRGFAKTTISENTALWATLYGHRKFVPIFGADAGAAERIIDSIKLELETNDLLYEDFPEVCHAIRALEGKPQRQHSQHLHGARTFIEFTAATVVLPTIEGSIASGAVLTAHGLTGAARGLKHKRADGVNLRPDLVLLDDIQTDESAKTPGQNDKRLKIIRKSILRMAGHRTGLAVILNGTIIEADDAVDQLSDPARPGSFQSERIPMIRKWADAHDSFWMLEYAKTRRTYDPSDVLGKREAEEAATALYVANRELADAGCQVSWESCYDADTEVSAIQHAYNILIDDGEDVFASECQNSPRRRDADVDSVEVNPVALAMRTNGLPRGVAPLSATSLTIHIDVQHSLLYWSALACDVSLTGSLIDRNTFPEQNSAYFALREATRKLSHAYPGLNPQEAVEQGLMDLVAHLVQRDWKNEAGTPLGVGLILIDWSDGEMDDVVAKVCRTSPYRALLMPAAGVGIGPNKAPMILYTPSQGETLGNHWIKKRNQKHAVMAVRVDTNHWKARATTALTCPKTMKGAITLYGTNGENGTTMTDHRMLADHYSSEKGTRLKNEDSGRVVTVFDLKPNRENHYWDNLIGAMVAASMKGCGNDERVKKEKKSLSELRAGRK